MTPCHCTQPTSPRTDRCRWPRAEVANALDHFGQTEQRSQRDCAEQLGIPHATFNYWTRQHAPAADDPIDSFFRSPAGETVLRRIVAAALSTFALQGAGGIRSVGTFIDRAGLERFVASSRGALQPLVAHLEADLVAFRDSEQPALVQQMKPTTITLVPDEHFHSGRPCLVAIEPVSNFIAVECYRDRRDADTWTEAITAGLAGMPVEVIQLTSDLARALVCCAEKGLQAAHSPDLFHDQRDLLQPVLLPLTRPIQQAEKELAKASKHTAKLDAPVGTGQEAPVVEALIESVRNEMVIEKRLEQAKHRQEKAVQEVRGVADDYHPFDRYTGQAVSAEEVGKRLGAHVDELAKVVAAAELGERPQQALAKARTWVTTLMGCVAWFWGLVGPRLAAVELTEEQEEAVKNKLLSGYYWEMAAGRARTGEEKQRLAQLAQELLQAARQDAALSSLPEETKKEVEKVAKETAGLFQRSSSCVEGRNGRLSLQQHGHSRVSERRLQALTVIHNYVVQRPDGTTAAQRFFGQKHKDVFAFLLQRMPDLPRPAQKRPKSAA